MLRDKSLVPLSHQHQHALALCVRIERAPKIDGEEITRWNEEIDHIFLCEILFHFEAEERILLPEANKYPEMAPLVNELLREHGLLRSYFERAGRGELSSAELMSLASTLSGHVRKEERQLFEDCQRLIPPKNLARLGAAMEEYFKTTPGASCSI